MGTYPLHAALQRLRRYNYRNAYVDFAELESAVDELVSAGANPSARDRRGNTALHYLAVGLADESVKEGEKRLFHLFLDLGVDIDVPNKAGWIVSDLWNKNNIF
jgi:ankyrin repeat protein